MGVRRGEGVEKVRGTKSGVVQGRDIERGFQKRSCLFNESMVHHVIYHLHWIRLQRVIRQPERPIRSQSLVKRMMQTRTAAGKRKFSEPFNMKKVLINSSVF